MKETARALQAWKDYLEMGPERSLPKLAERYRSGIEPVPTHQLSRLLLWSQQHGWQARLAEITAREQAAIEARGIADRQNRVNDLNNMRESLLALKAARAKSTLMDGVDGGETGLLVAEPMLIKVYTVDQDEAEECEHDGTQPRMIPAKAAEIAYKYSLDTGLIKSLLDVEKQAAQELGQWDEGTDTLNMQFVRVYVRDSE